jgi:hypothetical protein
MHLCHNAMCHTHTRAHTHTQSCVDSCYMVSGFKLSRWLSPQFLFLHEIPPLRYQQLIPCNSSVPLDGTVQCSSALRCYKFSTSKQLLTFRRKTTVAEHILVHQIERLMVSVTGDSKPSVINFSVSFHPIGRKGWILRTLNGKPG